MNLKYLGEGEVRKIMKSLGMICHIYILNVKQDLQPSHSYHQYVY